MIVIRVFIGAMVHHLTVGWKWDNIDRNVWGKGENLKNLLG